MPKNSSLQNFLFGSEPEITPELLEYYRKNPKELDLIIDKEHFHIRFLSFFFVLGLVITMGSRMLKFFFADSFGDFLNDVVLDVASELGIAIFGGAVTAYFLEILQKKQYEQNKQFRKKIKQLLWKKQTSTLHLSYA